MASVKAILEQILHSQANWSTSLRQTTEKENHPFARQKRSLEKYSILGTPPEAEEDPMERHLKNSRLRDCIGKLAEI